MEKSFMCSPEYIPNCLYKAWVTKNSQKHT